ncbi:MULTISPECIES: hypothetical protein [unclassified Rickettsia]
MTQPFFNVRTVVGLTTTWHRGIFKEYRNIAIFEPCNNATVFPKSRS